MIKLLTIFILGTVISICSAQNPDFDNFRSPSSVFGLDSIWADTNNVTCYFLPVKRNSNEIDTAKYFLAVAFVKSKTINKESPLLYLHGGPGIATLENLPKYLKSDTWKKMLQQHDLIFFDYRGTGFSEPALCNYLEDSLSAFSKTKSASLSAKDYEVLLYKNCREELLAQGTDLSTFTSFQLAADAEEIRKAMNILEWNIYGVSYGTTVALNVIRSFPEHIKSVILDSPFPPNAPWVDFVRPFDTCFKVLEKNILNDPVTAKAFPDLRNDFRNTVTRLNDKPALIKYKKDTTTIEYYFSGDDFAWTIWGAMLSPKVIPLVPLFIHEIGNGNDSLLNQWAAKFNTDSFGKFSETQSRAIICFEARPDKPEDREESLLKNYPDFASFNSGFQTDICNVWRPDTADKKIFEPVVSNIPVLILTGEYDPVCPPMFGDITAKTLSNGILLNIPSQSHAAIHADDCIRNIASNFLLNPYTKPDTACINRNKINFVTKDLPASLSKLK